MNENKTLLFLGREPALWMSLFASIIAIISAFFIPLTIDQQGVLNAIIYAAFGLAAAYFIDKGALATSIMGFFKALFALGIAFGLQLEPEKQSLLMTLVSGVVAMFIRTQVTPVNPPHPSATTRSVAATPAAKMTSLVAAAALLTSLFSFSGCASTGGGSGGLAYLRGGTALATSGALLAVSSTKRAQTAIELNKAAQVVDALSNSAPDPAALTAALQKVVPAQYSGFIYALASLYRGVYPSIAGNAAGIISALHDVALGVEDATAAYVPLPADSIHMKLKATVRPVIQH